MKRTLLAAILATAAIAFSCTVKDEPNTLQGDDLIFNPTATINDFILDGATTKTSFTVSDNKVVFAFNNDDVLRVYPLNPTGDGTRFRVKENKGTSCVFNGAGFGLKEGQSYAAYYPGGSNSVPPATAIPVDYSGQALSAKEAWDLSAVDYLVASIPAVEGNCNFSMNHVGALLIMDVTFAQAGTYTELSLTANDEFGISGTIDLTADEIGVVCDEFDSTITLALGGADGISVEEGETVRFCMMIAPINLAGDTLLMELKNGEDVISAEIEGKNYEAGKAYKLLGSPVGPEEPEEPLGDPIDLSANETANTYIVSEPGYYSINVIKAGNGKKVSWDSNFASVAYPEYNSRTGVKNFVGDGVEVTLNQNDCVSHVSYDDGKILFKATGAEGNAKLTLTYGGEYVWTWVIWCTDEPAVHPFTYEGITYHLMDRNLGATTDGSDSNDIEAMSGLYYQFGNPIGYEFEDFTKASEDPTGQEVGTMKRALADNPDYPTLDITKDYYWFSVYQSSKGNAICGKLWGGGSNNDDTSACGFQTKKTIYDPCPPGYKVMGWDTFFGYDAISYATAYGIYLPVDDGDLFIPYNGAAWSWARGAFWMGRGPYPCTIDGAGGPYADLWTSGHNARNMGYPTIWYAKDVDRATATDPGDGHIAARGMGVRCIADEFVPEG